MNNPTYWRTARLLVVVDHKWLTYDAEFADVSVGWDEIKDALESALASCSQPFMQPAFKIEFKEWDDEPQVDKEKDYIE